MNAMQLNNAVNANTVIVGLGTTGLSVARFLQQQQREFVVMDSRDNPPNAEDLKEDFANVPYHFGSFNREWLNQAGQIIVNPGIAVATPEIAQAQQAGAEVVGDIELFARAVNDISNNEKDNSKPIIAITGSNGKTTVTQLLDLMAKKSGFKVGTGGNIGTPALDLLADDANELFVLELSSFQLETTTSLHTTTAVILNVSEDHLDRYNNDIEAYAQAKGVIYKNCQQLVYNRDDAYSTQLANSKTAVSFGLNKPQENHYGIQSKKGADWLAKGQTLLMPVSDIKLPGLHNVSNALAALALGELAGLKLTAMLEVLREYAGLEHRTQWLANIEGIDWYNDSKGTNVGATLAALTGLTGKTVLIAGGQGKGADFSPLTKAIHKHAQAVVLMGEDADKIATVIPESTPMVKVESMQAAVLEASKLAKLGQSQGEDRMNVLLSPACASFDMFKNYMVRGEQFIQHVMNLESHCKKELV